MKAAWTVEKLRQVAEARGELVPDNRWVGELLLSHERYRGRTEEDYPKAKAQRELDAALDKGNVSMPPVSPREYRGLKQLRSYVDERGRQRQHEAGKATDKTTALKPVAGLMRALALVGGRAQEPEPEHENDRG